jgi:hypothetical protein
MTCGHWERRSRIGIQDFCKIERPRQVSKMTEEPISEDGEKDLHKSESSLVKTLRHAATTCNRISVGSKYSRK